MAAQEHTEHTVEMAKAYEPQTVEAGMYDMWLRGGYFEPRIEPGKQPFVVIMPPPNVTGELHLGHALTATIEDIMVRWHRMKGDPTLWLPGVDHAGIATQTVVERQLATRGITRHDLGREKFLERVWEWVRQVRPIIDEQGKRLGVSADWKRECFTLDPGPVLAVRTTFANLYNKGLIYRGERIINWCPRCATALSDLEVEHVETDGSLYYLRYPMASPAAPSAYIVVATTRPETMLGDTAVAVNPEDERYSGMAGRTVMLPIIGREIPIVQDDAIDPAFGTGAVKVTPGHDPVDFEIGQRHNLPIVNIMNLDGTMNENAGPYAGQDRFVARKGVIERLDQEGLLEKIEPYRLSVGVCQRCQTIVEPIVSEQWFVRMKPLAEPAIKVVEDGSIRIIPERFSKVYLGWLENIRDWCISRQLWWGHRIPVWYCSACSELTVAVADPETCAHCGSPAIHQDPDVLDTWFSSALWPESTLGWPNQTEDFTYYYPTSVMETGYDILFFWVARMVMMGLENTGRVPFRHVYLHGLVRDEKGEKMSKSRGNVLNPLELIDRYGTDALRYALATGSTPGNDMKLSFQKIEAGRNFANKLWNAARFVIMTKQGQGSGPHPSPLPEGEGMGGRPLAEGEGTRGELAEGEGTRGGLPEGEGTRGGLPEGEGAGALLERDRIGARPLADRWILSRLNRTVLAVSKLLEEFQFGEAGRQVLEFFWGEYCDWYLEMAKIRLRGGAEKGASPLPVLVNVLETSLRLLHPYMPFVTEKIWQTLKETEPAETQRSWPPALIVAPFPKPDETLIDDEAEHDMETIMEMVRGIRNARAEFGVEADKWVDAIVAAGPHLQHLQSEAESITVLARVRPLTIVESLPEKPREALSLIVDSAEVYLPLAGLVDLHAERQRIAREIGAALADISRVEQKLAKPEFLAKAPAAVINKERDRLRQAEQRLTKLRDRERMLG